MLGLAAAFGPATMSEAFAEAQANTAQKENSMTSAAQAATRRLFVRFR